MSAHFTKKTKKTKEGDGSLNDFDFDCLEKKRLARNAFSRKGTRNRKGCRLPHENLTKKEREAMNGECFTINTMEKISWERFKQLPTGLQAEYLNALMDRFGVGLANISRDLFGNESACLAQHCQRHSVRVNAHKSGKTAKSTLDRWHSWINSDLDIVPNPSTAPVSETIEEPHHSVNTICYEPSSEPAEEVKPFRAHDYEDMLRDCDLAKKDDEISETPPYSCPLQDMGINLEGTPVEIMTTLANAIPALLDQNKTYRFSIKVDRFFLTHGDRVL